MHATAAYEQLADPGNVLADGIGDRGGRQVKEGRLHIGAIRIIVNQRSKPIVIEILEAGAFGW